MNGFQQRPEGWWFIGLARIAMGVMWFEQARWKQPWDNYGGLRYWLQKSAEHPTFDWYKSFLESLVLPNYNLFGFQIWLVELLIAVLLFFGLFGRLGGLLGGLMSINLLIAMSKVPGEWYWIYIFIGLLGFIFFYCRAGRFIGVDQVLAPRLELSARQGRRWAKWLLWAV
jgi:hypothetical protein